MNKALKILTALLVCGVVGVGHATQDSTLDQKEVRDPRYLETWLETNAADAQSRLAAIEASGATGSNTLVTVGALYTTGVVTIAEGKLADSTIVSADIKNSTIVGADLDNTAAFTFGSVSTTGAVGIAEGMLTDSTVVSADIKNSTIVGADLDNTAAFTFGSVSTTGAVGIAEGMLTDSTVVSADIKNGTVVGADLDNTAAFTFGSVSTTGAVTISEGMLANSTVVSADIKDGEIAPADLNNTAAFTVGSLTTTGLVSGGGMRFAYASKSAAYTPTVQDYSMTHYPFGTYTNVLPDANTVLGQIWVITAGVGGTNMYVNTDGTDTLDGSNKQGALEDAGDTFTIQATGADTYTVIYNSGVVLQAIP